MTRKYSKKLFSYLQLMKPRVMSLVIFTAFIGIFLAQPELNILQMILPLLFIALGSGGAASLNMWYDSDIDMIMSRTKKRPIPSGKISKNEALYFGLTLSMFSVLGMKIFVNNISALLLAFSIFYYIVIYTIWLKRLTIQNIVIGGAAGAIPPIIGWTAITSNISAVPLFLFLIIFIWTPPHFWALALTISDDYKKAKIPMMPVIKGEHETKIHIFVYALILFAASIAPFYLGLFGIIYLISALLLGTYFIYSAFSLLKHKTPPLATFKFSIVYLFLLFLSLLWDRIELINIQ